MPESTIIGLDECEVVFMPKESLATSRANGTVSLNQMNTFTIIKRATLDITMQSRIAIVGPNGHGKCLVNKILWSLNNCCNIL